MSKSGGKSVLDLVQKEKKIVQAVIIADNFNNNFSPVSSTIAPCLLPLANRPLLDYTLHCLSSAGVQEVILFCSAFSDQIKEFVRNDYWGRMTVTVIISEGCRSFGDAMRDLDAKSVIRGDFILLTGDVVGNLKLLPALETHAKCQAVDKATTMTLLFKECGSRLKEPSEDYTLVTDLQSNRIISYFKNSLNKKKIEIPLELIMDKTDVDIRCDLMDTGIAVCSITVPPLFSDNFDFQTKEDFVRSLLMNDEIMDNTLYAYYLPKAEYAASAKSWFNYHCISHDIMHRWTYPAVPDTRYEEKYSYNRQNVYLQGDVSLSQSCSVTEDVVIGRGTVIGENTVISSSVIGVDCTIERESSIMNSHLLDKATVMNDCTLRYCVLGSGCIVKPRSTLIGCAIGPGVVVEEGSKIENMRLQSSPGKSKDSTKYGPKAFAYTASDESDSDSDEDNMDHNQWIKLKIDPVPSDVDEAYETTDSEGGLSDRDSPLQEDTSMFFNEVVDSLVRGFDEKISCDNLVLEINSSRYAYNVSVREVNYYVMKSILSLKNDKKWESLGKILAYFLPLLKNYMRNPEAMNDCLSAIEDTAETELHVKELTIKILHFLYDKDVVTEEAILHWHDNPRDVSSFGTILRKQVGPFIKWLKEADEQSTSEED